MSKITQIYSPYGTGPDGELIASKSIKVDDLYGVIYPDSTEPMQSLDATTYSVKDISSKLAELLKEEEGKESLNLEEDLSPEVVTFLGSLLKLYIYKDFFSSLRI